jgi:hypothetical protein
MASLIQRIMAFACISPFLGGASLLQGAAVVFEIVPSRATISQCAPDNLAVTFHIRNPGGVEIAGMQAFLRYPAGIFEPVSYEKRELNGFTASNGPEPYGDGFRSCAPPSPDPWDDGLGMDTVGVVSSVYGDGARNEPISSSEADLGAFIFRPVPQAPAGPTSFRLEFDSCSQTIQMGLAIFDGSGNPIDLSFPLTQVGVEVLPGNTVRNLACAGDPAAHKATITWDPPAASFDGVNVYRDGGLIRSMVPAFQRSLVDEDVPGQAVHYELVVVTRGKEDVCRASCSVDLGTAPTFMRGDANGDLKLNIADVSAVLNYLFLSQVLPCLDAADFDDTSKIELTDALNILTFLFQDGSPPASPYPAAGTDPTPDGLGCLGG